MKIEGLTEAMFAHAVALAQNGKMKSTIHCGGEEVFILNMDNTLILRYKSPQVFEESFSFFANDYESPRIRIDEGKVVFVTNSGGLKRTKVCPAPKTGFKEIKAIWEKLQEEPISPDSHKIILMKEMAALLEDGLSHVEVSKEEDGPVVLLQRDIYSGSRIEVERNKSGSGLMEVDDDFSFNPIGIRTIDFAALFTFSDSLTWYILPDKKWVFFEDNTGRLSGVLAQCLYDELGEIARID